MLRGAVLLVLFAVLAVGGVLLARGDSSDEGAKPRDRKAAKTSTQAAKKEPAAPAKPAGSTTAITVRGGRPVGGTRTISVKANTPVTIKVTADAADEAHLHGYDVEKELKPGTPAVFRLPKANLQGIYELELHESGAVLAKLRVNP